MPKPATWTRPEDLVGSTLGDRYRLIRLLGQGGMGAVYEGVHQKIDKRLAIKVLDPRLAADDRQKTRFLREARSATRIRSRHVVDITDFGEDPVVYFAMELLHGSDLAQLLRKHGPLPWDRAKRLLMQICAGLHAAHVEGVVHRDIKPSNIFVEQEEGEGDFVKILDFGIAKLTESSGTDKGITNTNEAIGTLAYMSPEQALGEPIDLRTDIYALGIVIFQMVTGEVPFDGTSQFQVMEKHVRAEPPALRSLVPSASAELEAAVLRCMAKEPSARFPSVEALAAVLDRVGDSSGARPSVQPEAVTTAPPRLGPPPAPVSAFAEKTVLEPVFEIGEAGELRPEPSSNPAGAPAATERLDNVRLRADDGHPTQALPEPGLVEPTFVERPRVAKAGAETGPPKPAQDAQAVVVKSASAAAVEAFTIVGRSGPSRAQVVVRVVAGSLVAMLAGGALALWLTARGDDEARPAAAAIAPESASLLPRGGRAAPAEPAPVAEPSGLVIGEPEVEPEAEPEAPAGDSLSPTPATDVPRTEQPRAPKSSAPRDRAPRTKEPREGAGEKAGSSQPDPFEAGPGPMPKPKPAPKAAPPKDDEALIRAAKRKALKRCGEHVKGAVASFQIMSSGSIVLAKVVPANTCAQAIVNRIGFLPRDKPIKKSFTF